MESTKVLYQPITLQELTSKYAPIYITYKTYEDFPVKLFKYFFHRPAYKENEIAAFTDKEIVIKLNNKLVIKPLNEEYLPALKFLNKNYINNDKQKEIQDSMFEHYMFDIIKQIDKRIESLVINKDMDFISKEDLVDGEIHKDDVWGYQRTLFHKLNPKYDYLHKVLNKFHENYILANLGYNYWL